MILPRPLCAVAVAAAATLAGCGGGGNGTGDADGTGADAEAGRAIFTAEAEPACSSCHTLTDAGATGTAAPNLDEVQPSAEQVERAVRTGPGIMPSYADRLTDEQIRHVAAYVEQAAGG